MKDNTKDLILENNITGRRYTGKLITQEDSSTIMKVYDKPTLIRKLTYVGLNNNPDNCVITYKQII